MYIKSEYGSGFMREDEFAMKNLGKDCPDYVGADSENTGLIWRKGVDPFCDKCLDCAAREQGYLSIYLMTYDTYSPFYCSGCLRISYEKYVKEEVKRRGRFSCGQE